MNDETDEALAARVRNDRYDTRPFDTLVRRHKGFVVSNCRVLTRSDADAEDLAQEVFVKAYFGMHQFQERGGFRSWIKRIKVNHCLNFLRKGRGRQVVDIDEVSPSTHEGLRAQTDPQQALDDLEERRRIVEVLDAMADTLRVPLMLRDGDGFSYQEIADRLGLGLSAVKMRIKRGREEFRRLYGDGEGSVGAGLDAQPVGPRPT